MVCRILLFSLVITHGNSLREFLYGRGNLTFENHGRYKRAQQSLFCATRKPEQCCPGDICCRVSIGDISCCCDEYCIQARDCCPDYIQTCQANPCNTYSVIQEEEKRSTDYETDFEIDTPFSDHEMNNTWFRVRNDNGDNMPTKPPGINHCGTIFPIWLNGTLPSLDEQNATRTVCVQTETNTCNEEISIEIQSCSEGFHVYRLQNTSENAAYCFGSGPVLCSSGLSSESGYYPGCTSSFPNASISPVVQAILTEGEIFNLPNYDPMPSLVSVFNCHFQKPDETYFYDVHWYINGQTVITHKNIPYSDISATTLKDSDWMNSYQMNMEVTCAVRIRCEIGSLPSPFHRSTVFQAGFFQCIFTRNRCTINGYNENRCGKYVKEPTGMKMSAKGNPLVFNERRGNPHTIEHDAASPKTSLYTGRTNELPLYTQPDKYEYTVLEGEHISIPFQATVPIGCISSHSDIVKGCYQNFYIYQPKYNDDGAKCINNIVNRDIVFQTEFCGIRVGNRNWNETKHLNVYGFSDGMYNHQGRSTVIKFSTTSVADVNVMWKNINIADIKITVVDKDATLTNRLCQSYNDPHITTYDGRHYHYMNVGEYVFYRNSRGPYWVHTLLTNCGFGWAGSACHCGIAIRSRQSLFVYRTCKKVSRKEKYLLQQPYIEVQTCGENDMSIENNGGNYKVTLPTGTEISFSAYSEFISSVTIKPSIYDINEAKGLCGVPSPTKDPSDDFYHRTEGPIIEDQIFGDSWRIDPNIHEDEQLFISDPPFLSEDPIIDEEIPDQDTPANNISISHFCVCEGQLNTDDEGFYTAKCNLTESTEFCLPTTESKPDKPNNAFVTTCSLNHKGKHVGHKIVRRSTTDNDDVIDHMPLEFDDDVFNETSTPVQNFRGNWTEEKANKTCSERLKHAIPSEISDDVPEFSEEDYIQSCIMDIKMTATTEFLDDTVNAVQTKTIIEISRNETLSMSKTDNKTESILDYITSKLCQNNCSKNGECRSGACECFDGFIRDDCSEKKPSTPTHISLPADGLCGTRSRTCRRTNVIGNFFSKDVWCKRKHFEIFNKSFEYSGVEDTIKADYRNFYLISVSLFQERRRKRSTKDKPVAEGYELRFSNDNKTFGSNFTFLVFDEECYSCDPKSITCNLKSTCPVTTTETPETITDALTNSSFNLELIVGTSCGILLLCGIFISVLVCKVRKYKLRRKKQKTEKTTGGTDVWMVYNGNIKRPTKLTLDK